MMITRFMLKTIAVVAILFFTCVLASAQATRTWVSGVGDDANPCSRTAPCKTFAGAISKTATGGEIDVLDPGGFGAVTITKSISIEACCIAGVLVSGTNGIVVRAPAGSFVVLRGLTFDGLGTGLAAIKFNSGGSLHVEDCTINDFTAIGIDFTPNQAQNTQLFVKDTKIRNCTGASSGGIHCAPAGGGVVNAEIDHVRLDGNKYGCRMEDNTIGTIRDTVADSSVTNGFVAASTSATVTMTLENCMSTNNASAGVAVTGTNGNGRMGRTTIAGNGAGFNVSAGKLFTTGDNHIWDGGSSGSLQPVCCNQ